MGAAKKKADETWHNPRRPATSREARQAQLEAKALNLIEQRLDDGTASSQETTLFAKSASTRGKLEEQRIFYENELLQAKKKQIESQERLQEMFTEAMQAMGGYRFEEPTHDDIVADVPHLRAVD
jgi:hypothetical protein